MIRLNADGPIQVQINNTDICGNIALGLPNWLDVQDGVGAVTFNVNGGHLQV
jgi:hypothetical protein